MQKTIDKYVYAVIRRCPKDQRQEIKKELESSILDMLSDYENPTELDLEVVLHKIGNPIHVAFQYQESPKHVVEPVFYQDYITILKFVLITFSMLAVLVSVIQALTTFNMNEPTSIIGTLFANFFENIYSFLMFAFAITTLVFWAYQLPEVRKSIDEKLKNWKTSDLNEVPKDIENKKEDSRVVMMIGFLFQLFFSLLFSGLFLAFFNQIGIYQNGEFITAFFNPDYYIYFVINIAMFNVFIVINFLFKFYKGKETFHSLLTETILEFIATIMSIVILLLPNLIHPNFIPEFALLFNLDVTSVETYTYGILYLVIGLIVFFEMIEYMSRWIKYFKNR
ncbi:Uncharacterised protein [Acholeplasma oculi]|uniref:Uncharacterized protein n=1 Tax=Acholeplasma oculi TaxID=35623 RepID=A0A061AGR9_9MOLU|nr:hypothetical protein [Acholeplasma oculi]CDR30756.1 hypothetical protein Aocu_06830 [Acholeplasma oculi]SKC34865.1 hypothetical protein SAMN02745122_0109 [Acholeplasma oculi]SUT89664.1 Uncharacterised protein [Acholeplasma oculi]